MKTGKIVLLIVIALFLFQGNLISPVHALWPFPDLNKKINPAVFFTPTPTSIPTPTPIVIIVTATPTVTSTPTPTSQVTGTVAPTATAILTPTSSQTEQVSGTPTPTPLPQSTGMTNIEKVFGIGFIIVLLVLLQSKWAAIRSWIHEKTK